MSDPIQLETFLEEGRIFPPSAKFSAQANASDPAIYDHAHEDPLSFWSSWAAKLDWVQPFHTVCNWTSGSFRDAKWFLGGKLNAAHNCVDRHAVGAKASKPAIVWEGEPGDVRTLTYAQLSEEVAAAANALKSLGVAKGDRVTIYMPMVPELPITMLACAKIGAVHCVVFGGFSAESLQERTNDAASKVIVTADGGWRRGNVVPLKNTVDAALNLGCPTVEKVLVLRRIGDAIGIDMTAGRDLWWHETVPMQSKTCPAEPMASEDVLFILHTSGSTGKPKGIVHSTGGYLTNVLATSNLVFDLHDDDVYFCTADCGWVTGHSYLVYGPLANRATCLMYEGAPDAPDKDRFWRLIERHKVTILYTAPTAIRAFMKWGTEYPERCNLSSLRLLGSVGEPINPEAWIWYHKYIGGERCPIVDTWWQTETGAIMISPLPGIVPTKPGSATRPFPGIRVAIMNETGEHEGAEGGPAAGILTVTHPWPGMTVGIFNDPDRFQATYWSRFPGLYFPGDGVKRDADGNYWLLGRVDDIMLVAGHNISTMEVESALVDHPAVAEAAVIGKTDAVKGQSIAGFVILRAGHENSEGLVAEIRTHVAKKIGALARPDDLYVCADLPKTRSGKIMRRLLRDVAEGRALGDTTTLADPAIVNSLKEKYEANEA